MDEIIQFSKFQKGFNYGNMHDPFYWASHHLSMDPEIPFFSKTE